LSAPPPPPPPQSSSSTAPASQPPACPPLFGATVPVWREAARWARRKHLEIRHALASGPARARANAALSWREFWHGCTRLHSRPRHIQVGTNWSCNLQCSFCRLTQDAERARIVALPREGREIGGAALRALLDLLPDAEVFQLTPLGEPLLWSGLPALLERHEALGLENLALTTNGMLLGRHDWAERLVRGRVLRVFVSIDSCDPATYAEMRVGGRLAEVEAGLEALNESKARLGAERPELVLAATFMRRNIEHLPAMVDFARRHRFAELSVQLMETENPAQEPEFLGHHIELTRRMVEESLRRAREIGQRVRIHLALRALLTAAGADLETGASEEVRRLSTRGLPLVQKCHYPWYYLLVDTDGDVRPCCWASVSWGNLNRQDFESIWNGEGAQQMRRDFLANYIPEGCRNKHCRVEL